MERSEMESFRNACNRYVSIVHSSGMRQHQIAHWMRNRIPLGCVLLCDICRHFASVMLHFASLISHNLRCIPAYTHQIPTGFICFGIHLNFWCVLVFFYCFVTICNPMIYNETSSRELFFWWWGGVGVGWQFWWGKWGKCGKLFVVLHYIWTIVGFFSATSPFILTEN